MPRGVAGWIPDQFQTLETINAPRKYKIIHADGTDDVVHMPANGKLSELDASLATNGAQRWKTYPEWVAEHVVPQTPEGWGVLLATGGAGLAGGLLKASGSLMAPIVRSGAFRVAAGVSGALAAHGLTQPATRPGEQIHEATGDVTTPVKSLGDTATSAFFQSLLGETGTFGLNLMSRNILNPMIRSTTDAKSYLRWLAENTNGLQNLPPGKAAQQLAALAMDQGLASRASTQIGKVIDQIAMQSNVKSVQSPALSRFLNEAKLEGHVADPQHIYPLRQALDNYTRIMSETMDPGNLARAESIRQAVYRDLEPALASGPKGKALFQNALNEYGFAKNVSDVMNANRELIFPKQGGFDAGRLTSLIHAHFGADPAHNDFIKAKVQDLLSNLQRGAQLGDPMDIKGSWGSYINSNGTVGFSPTKIRMNQWAGDPLTLGPTLKTIGNPLVEKSVEALGGIPTGGYRFQSPVTQEPGEGSIPASQ